MSDAALIPAPPDVQYQRVVIFDLDGTLCDIEHRRHFVTPQPMFREDAETIDDYNARIKNFKPDWDAFYAACSDDLPLWPLIVLMRQFFACGFKIYIVSGRSDVVTEQTKKWLSDHEAPYHLLLLRPAGCSTPDHELKQAWFKESKLRVEDVFLVFEDRLRCVQMWRELGLTCLQHIEGGF